MTFLREEMRRCDDTDDARFVSEGDVANMCTRIDFYEAKIQDNENIRGKEKKMKK